MVEVSLTIGKLDASLALLLTKDHHLIEFPTILLPNGVKAGSIVKIRCDQDLKSEQEEEVHFQSIQDEILSTFATNLPKKPVLRVKNVTQTSCVLEWDQLDLGTSSLKNLILFKDGKKLGSIPSPLTNKTSKLSGLPIDKSFKFQLRLDTTAGTYLSDEIEVNTHKMTDLSGITVCLGDFSANDPFTKEDIEEALKTMGAKFPPQEQVKVDTTHFLCTRENKQNPEYVKANEMNIPIIRPEWLKACERERRIVGVRDFYVKDCVLPDIFAKNYWKNTSKQVSPQEEKAEPELPTIPAVEEVQETTKADDEVPPAEEAAEIAEVPIESVPEIEITQSDEKLAEDIENTQQNIDDAFGEPTEEEVKKDKPVESVEVSESEPVAEAEKEVVLEEIAIEQPEIVAESTPVEEVQASTNEVANEEPQVEEVALDEPKVAAETAESHDATTSEEPAKEELQEVSLVEPVAVSAEPKVETEESVVDESVVQDITSPENDEVAGKDNEEVGQDEEDEDNADEPEEGEGEGDAGNDTTATPAATAKDKKKKKKKKNKKN
ncbi:uncharacterized protein SPAPADRAFT_50273 [Spathaspora passalidarum NRRL Y-27907]|uniref:Chitin biosynthesis protein CHS5 n=1 Tax=Spathaspora passalidarum (strain NRRL Y-27907 / 11-Y1) TaxID=619300 RepID=G3AM90_SPAPN|nr:uncharacterized protein SPAPADRAFT_50273 [Spathaspora passalidarum NRRL Y-27907]EGW33388.1 hypothetical protein SPAPADRAFT_50273 [Spathaspora passalidarum NRRL Y-27907]